MGSRIHQGLPRVFEKGTDLIVQLVERTRGWRIWDESFDSES